MDPVTGLAALGLAGLGAYAVLTPTLKFPDRQDNIERFDAAQHHRDLAEAGISWGTQRAWVHHMTDLNDAYRPRTAPQQQPTRNLDHIWRDQAEINAYLQRHGPQFYFMRDSSIPLAVPQQSTPNVEIISRDASFRHDPGYSLTYYPRAYVDDHSGQPTNSTFSYDRGTTEAGQPETWEVLHVPVTGLLNFNQNPYGPGGAVQQLNAHRNEAVTRHVGLRQAAVMRPPAGAFAASRYPRP